MILNLTICNDILLWTFCVAHVNSYDNRSGKIGRVNLFKSEIKMSSMLTNLAFGLFLSSDEPNWRNMTLFAFCCVSSQLGIFIFLKYKSFLMYMNIIYG